jgi:hypothetical protein
MKTAEKNNTEKTNVKKGVNPKKGESIIWDDTQTQSVEEFMDFAINGLAHHFNYNSLVFGFIYNKSKTKFKTPNVIGTCRGNVELAKLFKLFSDLGLVCVVETITNETKEMFAPQA